VFRLCSLFKKGGRRLAILPISLSKRSFAHPYFVLPWVDYLTESHTFLK
jgi:hypothetical protein